MLNDFTNGNPELQARLNELVAVARKVENISGGGEVQVRHTANGINITVERRRGGGGGGGGSGGDRRAFAKVAAGSGATIVCYLDTDITGEEVTVDCDIANSGTDLEDATPLLGIGTPMYVVADSTASAGWRSKTLFDDTQDCA